VPPAPWLSSAGVHSGRAGGAGPTVEGVVAAYPWPVLSPRSMIDYSLARRAVLSDLYSGRASTFEVCDAHPYLQRAARYHGEQTDVACPVCRRERLLQVIYTYGDCFPSAANGRARAAAELEALAREHPEFTVYVVEVCRGCGWNYLTSSYVLGTGSVAASGRRAARRRAADE
jgi:hypothetical protein